jgi:formylmethanofuran dehydrogenase subunit E
MKIRSGVAVAAQMRRAGKHKDKRPKSFQDDFEVQPCVSCPEEMIYKTFLHEVSYKNNTIKIKLTTWKCDSCNEIILEGDSLEKFNEIVLKLRAKNVK